MGRAGQELCFNPSRGIAIIQTGENKCSGHAPAQFQSLTRDSNHSNLARVAVLPALAGFNPSRGIAIIQTFPARTFQAAVERFQSLTRDSNHSNGASQDARLCSSCLFQSLTRDSNHSNMLLPRRRTQQRKFQSLTRDSNHSNNDAGHRQRTKGGFNPSRGIAIIQTDLAGLNESQRLEVSIPHAG